LFFVLINAFGLKAEANFLRANFSFINSFCIFAA
jgi:hypothetical protein